MKLLLWIIVILLLVYIDGKYLHLLNHMGLIPHNSPLSCSTAPKC